MKTIGRLALAAMMLTTLPAFAQDLDLGSDGLGNTLGPAFDNCRIKTPDDAAKYVNWKKKCDADGRVSWNASSCACEQPGGGVCEIKEAEIDCDDDLLLGPDAAGSGSGSGDSGSGAKPATAKLEPDIAQCLVGKEDDAALVAKTRAERKRCKPLKDHLWNKKTCECYKPKRKKRKSAPAPAVSSGGNNPELCKLLGFKPIGKYKRLSCVEQAAGATAIDILEMDRDPTGEIHSKRLDRIEEQLAELDDAVKGAEGAGVDPAVVDQMVKDRIERDVAPQIAELREQVDANTKGVAANKQKNDQQDAVLRIVVTDVDQLKRDVKDLKENGGGGDSFWNHHGIRLEVGFGGFNGGFQRPVSDNRDGEKFAVRGFWWAGYELELRLKYDYDWFTFGFTGHLSPGTTAEASQHSRFGGVMPALRFGGGLELQFRPLHWGKDVWSPGGDWWTIGPYLDLNRRESGYNGSSNLLGAVEVLGGVKSRIELPIWGPFAAPGITFKLGGGYQNYFGQNSAGKWVWDHGPVMEVGVMLDFSFSTRIPPATVVSIARDAMDGDSEEPSPPAPLQGEDTPPDPADEPPPKAPEDSESGLFDD